MIISVSRRCDIPRFQFDWFMERLDAGFTDTVNPFNKNQVRRVSLAPEEVDALVFWTRDPRPILNHREALEERGCRYYVMITLTGYPEVLEPQAPPVEAVIAAMGGLAEKCGPQRVIWRYDPLILSSLTDGEFHRRNFRALTHALAGIVHRVIISLYDPYPGAERRLAGLEQRGALKRRSALDAQGRLLPEIRELLAALARTAREAGMAIYACAEAEDLAPLGIAKGACIDGGLIKTLWGIETGGKDKNQRPHCGCVPSVDIGRYGACPAGCIYCYARR
jgi:DNA repair photolyase